MIIAKINMAIIKAIICFKILFLFSVFIRSLAFSNCSPVAFFLTSNITSERVTLLSNSLSRFGKALFFKLVIIAETWPAKLISYLISFSFKKQIVFFLLFDKTPLIPQIILFNKNGSSYLVIYVLVSSILKYTFFLFFYCPLKVI